MHLPSRAVRRVAIPLYLIILTALAGLFLFGLVLGAVLAPFGTRRRPLRIAAFGLSYCSMELAVLGAAAVLWLQYRVTSTDVV